MSRNRPLHPTNSLRKQYQNEYRQDRGERVTIAYLNLFDPEAYAEKDSETVLTDLLADLMHYASNRKIDFCWCHARAQAYYEAETAEEEPE